MTQTMTAKEFQKTALEKDVKASILSYLHARGIIAWNNHRGAGVMKHGGFVRWGGMKGSSDILGVMPGGRFIAIETKRRKGTYGTTEEQDEFLEKIVDQGGIAFVARSVNDVVDQLSGETW